MEKVKETVHYIMALDESGSMNGAPWKSLLSSLSTFFRTLEEAEKHNPGMQKVSVIQYTKKSRVIFTEQTPSKKLMDKIKMESGGTFFDPPLTDAYNIFMENLSYHKLVFYFMTDGDGSFSS